MIVVLLVETEVDYNLLCPQDDSQVDQLTLSACFPVLIAMGHSLHFSSHSISDKHLGYSIKIVPNIEFSMITYVYSV